MNTETVKFKVDIDPNVEKLIKKAEYHLRSLMKTLEELNNATSNIKISEHEE